MRTAEHFFEVPLDHFGRGASAGETITVFAREYVSTDHSEEAAAQLPWLLYLQGGPGGRGNRLPSLGGWNKAAAKDFRILMLDQRGTGLSSAIDRNTLPLRGNDADQADYLAHFRADSIVADAEAIRLALGSGPWTIYGQSYGGFCALSYLSFAPEGLREALITGGLGPLAGPADRVYRATFSGWRPATPSISDGIPRTARRSPGSPGTFAHGGIPARQRTPHRGALPDGGLLPGRQHPGGCAAPPAGGCLRRHAGRRPPLGRLPRPGPGLVSRSANPLYALMHESIYGQGESTDWAAWRVLQDFPEFSPEAPEPLLTGEMVYPWYFEQDAALRPLQNVAGLLAEKDDWPQLYDPEQLALNTVPVAAAVYSDDIYVDRDLSLETAAAVRGLQVWESADFHHDGIADDGEGIFARLLGLTRSVRA